MAPSLRWDIFCRVVDNFGDAGVSWRLARQLAHEHGLAVTLWIDDIPSLARIAPALDVHRDDQAAAGVRVRRLADDFAPESSPPDVVIEAFDAAVSGRRPGQAQTTVVVNPKAGRNEPCPCGSGKKYKKCHGS